MTDLRPGRARPRLQRRHFSTKPPRSPQLAAHQLSQAPVTREVSTGSWISAAQPRISPTLGKGERTQSSWSCLSKHLGQLCKQSPVLFCTGKWHLPVWRVWMRVPREPASVRPSGIWDLSSSLPRPLCGWGWQGTPVLGAAAASAPLGHLQPPPGTVGWEWGPAEQLQPDSQDAPTPPRAGFGNGFACEGSPRASPRPQHRARPAQLCSALLQTSPRVPEDSPAPALSPNTILSACFLPHVSFPNRNRLA